MAIVLAVNALAQAARDTAARLAGGGGLFYFDADGYRAVLERVERSAGGERLGRADSGLSHGDACGFFGAGGGVLAGRARQAKCLAERMR